MIRQIALCLMLALGGAAQAQDVGLALERGLPDLGLFALTRSEAKVSLSGRMLLSLQGFMHDPEGPRLQPLSRGRALIPLVRHDTNVNDGIPSDRITLGGLPFRVAEDSRAKDAVLLGLQYSQWTNYSFGRAARLRFAQSFTAEVEPTYGYHHLAASGRVCAEQPVMSWTWLDACLTGLYDDDGVDSDTSLTASLGARRIFASPFGFHQASASLARARNTNYDKDILQFALKSLTEVGVIGADLVVAERIDGENTLLHLAGLSWTGRFAERTVTFGVTQSRTGGATIFGASRKDRITRFSVEIPVGKIDLGAFAERRKSTIDAYEKSDVGVTVGFRVDFLRGRR